MKLISIYIENFRQHLATRIDFQDGVTAIVGQNGSGKTTILEAIAWALYGSPAVRENNSTVRSTASDGGAKVNVALTFELSGQTYTIKRRMDSSGGTTIAALEQNGQVIRKGQKEVSEALARMLGMDYRAFFNSFFTAQKDLEFMSRMEGPARAAAISKMLGYERITKAREKVVVERRQLDANIEGLMQGLGDAEEIKSRLASAKARSTESEAELKSSLLRLSECDSAQDAVRPQIEASEKKRVRNVELTANIERSSVELSHLQSRFTEAQTRLKEMENARIEMTSLEPKMAEINALATEFKELRTNIKYGERRKEIDTTISIMKQDIQKLTESAGLLKNAEDQCISVTAELKDSEKRLQELEKSIRTLSDNRIAALNTTKAHRDATNTRIAELSAKRHDIESAGEEGACPTCERPLAGELSIVLAGFDTQIHDLTAYNETLESQLAEFSKPSVELTTQQQELQSLKNKIPTLRKSVTEHEAAVREAKRAANDLHEKHAQIAILVTELSGLPEFDKSRYDYLVEYGQNSRPISIRYGSLAESLKNEPKIKSEMDSLEKSINKTSTQINEAQKQISELGFVQLEHDQLLSKFNQAQASLTEARIKCERSKSEAAAAVELLNRAVADDERYRTQAHQLEEARERRLYLHTLHSTLDKFRDDLNARIRPELEVTASEILSEVTDGRYGLLEIEEDYRAFIRDDGEKKWVISGGEQDVVNLALRLAVSQMIADRAGQDLSLLIMDEVFGSLDEGRRDNLVSLLQNLKNRFEQIIIITHIESIHDAVDNTIWVDFDEKTKTSSIKNQSDDDDFNLSA